MSEALGLVEIAGLCATIVALDALDKAATVRLLQVELNDQLGAQIKFTGDSAAVRASIAAAEGIARQMHAACIGHVIDAPDAAAWPAIEAKREFNPLLEADVVFIPGMRRAALSPGSTENTVNKSFALGLIETQGLTAVMEAIDTAAKAANVEVIGREKLGGGYVTVIIKGDVAAVKAAVAAGGAKVEGLGKLIAAHVIARPSEAVLSLLPKG